MVSKNCKTLAYADDLWCKRAFEWRCRRGLLELDVLLLRFFQAEFFGLSHDEKQSFQWLLTQDDQCLQNWLLFGAQIQSGSPMIKQLIDRIKQPQRQFS